MFKRFFEDHNDAMHYAKVMPVLLKEFGLQPHHIESNTSTISAVKFCGELRRQGHNVESTALALVIALQAMRLAFPEKTNALPPHGGDWIRKALDWALAGKVSAELMRILKRLELRSWEIDIEQDPEKKALRIKNAIEVTSSEMEQIAGLVFYSPRAQPL
jgi:hypothetical protein